MSGTYKVQDDALAEDDIRAGDVLMYEPVENVKGLVLGIAADVLVLVEDEAGERRPCFLDGLLDGSEPGKLVGLVMQSQRDVGKVRDLLPKRSAA